MKTGVKRKTVEGCEGAGRKLQSYVDGCSIDIAISQNRLGMQKAGCCKLEHMPDTDFRTNFIPNLSRYVKDCMSPMVRALASVQNRKKDEHVCIYSVLYVCSCTYVCV